MCGVYHGSIDTILSCPRAESFEKIKNASCTLVTKAELEEYPLMLEYTTHDRYLCASLQGIGLVNADGIGAQVPCLVL